MGQRGAGEDNAVRAIVAAVRERLLAEQETETPGIPQVAFTSPESAEASEPAPPGDLASERSRGPQPVRETPSAGPIPGAVVEPTGKRERLTVLEGEARTCTACGLHKGRNKSVFARGNPDAELVFVGEGPGRDEDLQGAPFVGAAGQLLDRMIAAMGFAQDEVYICNVVKCRPPENRTPRPDEAAACAGFLHGQIDAVAPRVIVALGRCAADNLGLAPERGAFRGRWGTYRGAAAFATYHPAYLLRTPEAKRIVWADLQQVMERFGKKPPARKP